MRWPTASTSSCAAAARRCSKTEWRETDMATPITPPLYPRPLYPLKESPSQTAGHYVHIGLAPNFCGIPGVYASDLGVTMVDDKTKGERITHEGRVIDGGGNPLKD